MSFSGRTPESLLTRSDSKNPATTCKGITSAGRPCRRALATAKATSPASSPNRDDDDNNGVLAILDAGDAAAFFCWQHKDQAENLVAQLKERSEVIPLRHKSSIDTLIERVGILDLDDNEEDGVRPAYRRRQPRVDRYDQQNHAFRKRNTLPQQWQHIQGPLMSVPEEVVEIEGYSRPRPTAYRPRAEQCRRDDRRRSNVKASWSCCVQADNEEYLPPARRRRRSDSSHVRSSNQTRLAVHRERQALHQQDTSAVPFRRKPVSAAVPEMQQYFPSTSTSSPGQTQYIDPVTPTRPQLRPRYNSSSPPHTQTATFLSLIPPHLSPATTSALLTELSRPISDADEEGYIYIFWLTPESELSKPDDETASSLLDPDEWPPTSRSPRSQRQYGDLRFARVDKTTQALRRYASVRHTSTEPQKILLKIGRAANVHRRLSQWTKQCGQNITLIRFYPYQSGATDMSPGSGQTNRKVRHVHRVERLIHLELADKRLMDKGECEACGRVHKEWFEVEATKDGVRQIDEVVRRWVGWAEQHDTMTI